MKYWTLCLFLIFFSRGSMAALPSQQTPPPPPTAAVTPTPTTGGIIELFLGDKYRAFKQGWQTNPWVTLVVLFLLTAGVLAWFFYGPEGNKHRDWLGGIWNRLRGIRLLEPVAGYDALTADTLLVPLGPNEEKRFVIVRLFLPPKGDRQEYSPTDITFNSLQEALEAGNPETEPQQPFSKLALLGEPGAGKTWLLRKLAQEAVQRCKEGSSAPTPLLVSLGSHRTGSPEEFLRSQWSRFWPENPHGKTFDQVFGEGRLLLLADGLNEINRKQYQNLVSHWRRFLAENFLANGNRAIIACRKADFGSALPIPRLETRPLEPERIQEYLQKRLGPAMAKDVWDEIDKDEKYGRSDLLRLAENPFWLDKMAAWSETGGLPHSRAQLARDFIQCRLDEELVKHPEIQLGESGWEPYLEGMSLLAWKGLWRSANVVYMKAEAKQILIACRSLPAGSAERLLQWATSGQILEEINGGIKFHHQLFQEYFAACRLAEFYNPGEKHPSGLRQFWLEYRLWHTPWGRINYQYSRWDPLEPPPRPDWAEATILAIGLVKDPAERLVTAVLRKNPTLAGECIHKGGVEIPKEIRGIVRQRLETLVQQPPFWIFPLASGARFVLGIGKAILPENWRNRLQAWRLLPTAVRLGASRQLGYFDDDPITLQRRSSLAQDGERSFTFIEPDWVDIPDGVFRMGSNPQDEIRLLLQRSQAFADEKPDHMVNLERYKIGRTPVTVAEFRCFIQADGYKQEAYWPEGPARLWWKGELNFKDSFYYAAYIAERADRERYRAWLVPRVARGEADPANLQALDRRLGLSEEELEAQWLELEMQKRNSDRQVVKPWLWEELGYDHPAQPIVGISWYEAQAYVAWLDDILHQDGRLPDGWRVSLPSEAQWEKAARGTDGRLYPWGNWWSMNCCNSQESRVLAPSPVMMYPHGASPYGALGMAGNVWEWCQDWYDPNEYERRKGANVVDPTGPETGTVRAVRAVRGGSWLDHRCDARCASRGRHGPDDFSDNLGFRVVCAPN